MPKALLDEAIYQGSYPELVLRNYEESENWYASYIETYLNKDLRALTHIGDIRDFRRFLSLLAAQVGQLLDMTHFAKAIGVSVPTIKRWLSILEASYIIFLLPPFYNNLGKRVIKSPKVYFFDTGLVSFLSGIRTFEQYDQGPLAGPLFENYVVSEIYKKELHHLTHAELYFFRTQDKAEVDLVIDRKQHLEWIEIKKTATFKTNMASALKTYPGPKDQVFLYYQGENDHYKNIQIRNYQKLLLI